MKNILKIWINFSDAVEKIGSFVVMALIYFIVIGSYAFVLKLAGIIRVSRPKKISSWQYYPSQSKDMSKLEQEF